MTDFALDTNAYRALREKNATVVKSVAAAGLLGLPIIVLGELYYGIERGSKKEFNTTRLQSFVRMEKVNILHITTGTARIFGEISAELAAIGRPVQQNDVWIAAICKQYGYTLLSADKGFGQINGLDTISF